MVGSVTLKDLLKSQLQKLLEEHNFELIYTPPYSPLFQPIEEFWGFTKNTLALYYRTNRTTTETYGEIMDIWYGQNNHLEKNKPGVFAKNKGGFPAKLALDYIRHADEHMDEWIKENGWRCKGSFVKKTFAFNAQRVYLKENSTTFDEEEDEEIIEPDSDEEGYGSDEVEDDEE